MAARLWFDLKTSAWYVRVHDQRLPKGRKSYRIGASEKEARGECKKINTALRKGTFNFNPQMSNDRVPTLNEYWEIFRRAHLETAVRPSTKESYEGSFHRYLLPAFGKLPLDQITLPKIDDFVSLMLENEYAKDTVRIVMAELRKLFNHAIKRKVVRDNPAASIGDLFRQAKRVHDEIMPLTAAEVPVLLQTTADNFPYHYEFFLTAIHTGMRSGELRGFQWSDVDFRDKFIIVRRSIDNSGRINPTKTSKIRRVDLSDALHTALKQLKARRAKEWKERGLNKIPEWVFCTQEGTPLDVQNIKNRVFFPCLELAELRRIRFHDLRHTFASLLISNGESLAYVKDQLGHSSIKMTVDVYGHLVPGSNRQAVNRLPAIKSPQLQNVIMLKTMRKKA